ncbi:MAG: hypothetical protein JO266_15355 [Acidobacteria bacterium]|nr:hypothetical protein [Acidobacteriota bacterium]
MSKFEWMELETISNEIAHAQSRLDAARATKNLGLVQLLEREIADATKRRAQILSDITNGLGVKHSAHSKPQLVVAQQPQEAQAKLQAAVQTHSRQSIEPSQAQHHAQTQSQPPSERGPAAAAAALDEPVPSADIKQGDDSMWDKVTSADIEGVKRALASRRSELLTRHAEELKVLEAEEAEIDVFEKAIATFTQKFKLTSTAEIIQLEGERVPVPV